MKKSILFIFPIIIVLGLIPNAGAIQISYILSDLGGGDWGYSYTIANDSIAGGLYWFDIYFPSVSGPESLEYSNITETGNPDPTNWNTMIFDPSPLLGGVYDALTLNTPIALNNSLSGFSVSFHYSGTDILREQYFEIYDLNFSLLEDGTTIPSGTPVPEPTTLVLLGSGIFSFFGFRRWTQRRI